MYAFPAGKQRSRRISAGFFVAVSEGFAQSLRSFAPPLVTASKLTKEHPINLNSFAKEILAKYEDQRFPNVAALPVISNQKMNDYLKDLCELCEFNTPITRVTYRAGKREETTKPKYELIGTHAGRRTFICFALSSGIPPQVVMKWTGHSDYKAMKPYIDIAEKVKAEQMAIFEKELKA